MKTKFTKNNIILFLCVVLVSLLFIPRHLYINETFNEHKTGNEVKFITLTNSGYIDYTFNCLESLKKCGYNDTLHCHCIGKEGHEKLISKGYQSVLIDQEQNSNFQQFRKKNWSNIVVEKYRLIYENLLQNKYVCITDGDIVFENNIFMKYLLDTIKDNELLIQNDTMDDKDTGNLCSGFMFIKSTPNTIDLFNPKHTEHKKNEEGWGDQIYMNEIKHKLKYKTLPLRLFPNGQYYYKKITKYDKPYLIHFNWVVGHEKKKKMKEHNKWYI